MTTVRATLPPVHAPAPPVQRRPAGAETAREQPHRLLRSLTAVPAVQRQCAACRSDDDQRQSPVMPQLEVGPVDDPYEREADAIAGQVMAMRESDVSPGPAQVQRICASCSSEEEPRARRVAQGDDAGQERIAASESQLTSGGSSLPMGTRSYFETRMGRDLAAVRVHEGRESQVFNKSSAARAFTYKHHIWLGVNETSAPSFTMAHELAHVLQQTAPGTLVPQSCPAGPAAEQAGYGEPVLRRRASPFWLPDKDQHLPDNALALHTAMHDRALEEIGEIHKSILSEVPIPGANRKLIGVGTIGRADIYTERNKAHVMVPGVRQEASALPAAEGNVSPGESRPKLANLSLSMGRIKQGKARVPYPDSLRAPQIIEGSLKDINKAPVDIEIGEMKPFHDMDYRKSGASQIANYIAAINQLASAVNTLASSAGLSEQWLPKPKAIDAQSLVPVTWDARKSHTDWPLPRIKIRHYKASRAGSSGKPGKAANARQGRPKSQPIRGRWMMAPDNEPGHNGVLVYFLAPHPGDLKAALATASTRTEFHNLAARLEKIKADLIASPRPVSGGGKAKPRRLPASGAALRASAAPGRPVRKEVKDTFKSSNWELARTGAGREGGSTDESLLAAYASAADNVLREEIAEQGAMAEWLQNKPSTLAISYDQNPQAANLLVKDLRLLKSLDFWTGLKAKPFGILREKFGLFFVTTYQKVVDFADKIGRKFKSFDQGRIMAGRTGTIIKAAAKVASVILPRLVKPFLAKMFNTIIDCGITGFEAKFKELVEGTLIEEVIETADQLKGKVEALSTNVDAFFKDLVNKTFSPISKEFEQFVSDAKLLFDVVSMVKQITQALRIGSCVAGLASAPETVGIGAVVGCGAALGDFLLSQLGLSPVDHLIGTILSSCEMQNKLGVLMAGIGFIKTLPKRAGTAIISQVKTLLRDGDTLNALGTFKGKNFGLHASELFCNPGAMAFPDMGYETTDCSDTGSYRTSKTGTYEIPPDIPLYEKKDAIPESEKPWMYTEIPSGRRHQLNPIPGEKSAVVDTAAPPPASPPDGLGKPASQGDAQATQPDHASEAKAEKTGKATTINLAILGGFDPTIAWDGSQSRSAHLSATDSSGVKYDVIPVEIWVHSVYNKAQKTSQQWRIKFRFKLKSKGSFIVLHDISTGTGFRIWDSDTKIFDVPLLRFKRGTP